MTVRTGHYLRVGLVAGAAALALTGCTTPSPPGPAGADTGPATDSAAAGATAVLPLEQVDEAYQPAAQAYTQLRQWDTCALHDPDAAGEVTGDTPSELMPTSEGLDQCVLRLEKSPLEGTWNFYIEVGGEFGGAARRSAAPETIGGVEVFRQDLGEDICSYTMPVDDNYGVELHAQASISSDAGGRSPCEVAQAYLSKIMPRWQNPPRRGTGASSPDLALGLADPCVAAPQVLAAHGDGRIQPTGPYQCTIRLAGTAAKDKATAASGELVITYQVADEPKALAATGTASVVTVADKPGVRRERESSHDCKVTVATDPDVLIVADETNNIGLPQTPVVAVTAADCDQATAAAETVVKALGGAR